MKRLLTAVVLGLFLISTACGADEAAGHWPNQPEGFVVFNTRTFNELREDGWDDRGVFSIVADDTGRSGTGTVGQRTFARGEVSGGGISSRWWPSDHQQHRDLYVATYMKISTNFRQDSSGITKIWYNRGLSSDSPHANHASQVNPQVYGGHLGGSVVSRHHAGTAGRRSGSARIGRGEWVLVELLVRSSTGDAGDGATEPNGDIWLFINGKLDMHWPNVHTHRSGDRQWWESVELNTIWGGGGNRMNSWEVIASEEQGQFIAGATTFVGNTQFTGELIRFDNGRYGWYNPAFERVSLAVEGPNHYFVPSVILTVSNVKGKFTPGAAVRTNTGDYRDLQARVIQQTGNELELMVYRGHMDLVVGETLTQESDEGVSATIAAWADWDPEVGVTFTGQESGATATIGEIVHAGSAYWRFDHHRISLGNLPPGYSPAVKEPGSE